ncbi:3-hydroxyisobutyryl-CoA hydrolase 1-like [Mercurialis annua]|uniref:3-hydroxyisobutyryl-CoA hydrolase 1-like n=1 Tax=Mercurialis annua TaxID=3986 RepID=UPI00215FE137|nr:3-hydroxyisobutyryl-CoA hydrolase 1-like [Mercurialis annua]
MVSMASPTSSNCHNEQVLVEENLCARTLILNRPKQLNALSYQMICGLLELFLTFEEDPHVKLLLLKGNGRAFCAGGDVSAVVRDIRQGNWKSGAKFFGMEFILNYVMATYTKPQVSILNGIVMGGGGGASMHGRFRVATDNSVFAMPETALGLFPDVGASYFLSRLPGFFGEFVGLTGSRLDGAEMLACGLATHFVPLRRLSLLEEALHKVDSSDPSVVSCIIDKYCQPPHLKHESAYHRLDVIDRCFSQRSVEDILSALETEAMNKAEDAWISSTIQSLKKASPTSLKISLRSIREGRLQGVGQCLVREYRMVCHVMQGKLSKDFFEGCRAILLDKDKNPKWEPRKLELVSDIMVERYFSKVEDGEWEDLKLPARFNLPDCAIAKL